MGKYIEESYLLNALGALNDYGNANPHFLNGIQTAREVIVNAPAADVAQVGRCSQCDNFSKKDSWCYPNESHMEETDFCSYFEPINHSNQ